MIGILPEQQPDGRLRGGCQTSPGSRTLTSWYCGSSSSSEHSATSWYWWYWCGVVLWIVFVVGTLGNILVLVVLVWRGTVDRLRRRNTRQHPGTGGTGGRGTMDRVRRRNTRQHPGVGGTGVASKWLTDRHAAVRRISGRRRPWSDCQLGLGPGVQPSAEELALRSGGVQVTVLVAIADDVLFHMDSGRSLN